MTKAEELRMEWENRLVTNNNPDFILTSTAHQLNLLEMAQPDAWKGLVDAT